MLVYDSCFSSFFFVWKIITILLGVTELAESPLYFF